MHRLSPGSLEVARSHLGDVLARHPQARLAHRLAAILLLGAGLSCYQVAHCFGADPRTVERWVHRFQTDGIDGLSGPSPQGRRACLDGEALQGLGLDLRRDPRQLGYPHRNWSGKLLAQHLRLRYGIELGVRQCQRLLRRQSERVL